MAWHEVRVALHVHSRYSDGSGTVEAIAAAAAGLVDVVWLTDHDGLWARESPGEGRYGPVLLLVGTEMTPPTDHLLVLGTDFVPDRAGPWEAAVQAVRNAGGVAFVAHPEDPGNPRLGLPSYRWTRREVRGFTGIEVWNHLSQWARAVRGLKSGLWALGHPLAGAQAPDAASLGLWDALSAEARTVGVLGLDAHAVRIPHRRFGMPVFPYRRLFGWLSNHLWLEEPLAGLPLDRAREALLMAFREGRVALVNETVGRELGFRLRGRAGTSQVGMGAEIGWAADAELLVQSPVPALATVMAEGRVLGRHRVPAGEPVAVSVPHPAAARVELWRERGGRLVPWLFSNPIYFRSPKRPPRNA